MSKKRLLYIPTDGYTEPAYVKEVPGLLDGSMAFSYRPFLVEDRARILSEMEKMRSEAAELRAAQEIADRLTEWDLTDATGKPVPISLDIVRRLKPLLFARVWGILLGTEATDFDPDWDLEDKRRIVNEQAEAISRPAPVGNVREEGDEKNSETG